LEPQTREFIGWLTSKKTKYKVVASTYTTIALVASAFVTFIGKLNEYILDDYQRAAALALIQAAVLVVMLFVRIDAKHFEGNAAKKDIEKRVRNLCGCTANDAWVQAQTNANAAQEQFESIWRGTLLAWVLLYAVLGFGHINQARLGEGVVDLSTHLFDISSTTISNLSTILLVGWFVILAKVTTGERAYRGIAYKLAAIVLVLFAGHVVLVFGHESGATILGFPTLLSNPVWPLIPKWISGVFAAMAFALVIGRLDSKFINAPTAILICLYTYAAIQPLFIIISGREFPHVAQFLIILAMLFKAILYFLVIWMLEQGRLLFYFARIRRLHDNVESEIDAFQKLKLV